MQKWLRILGVAAGLLAGLWLVIIAVAANYDYNQLKPLVADAVRQYTGRKLAIGGDIRFKIGFHPILTVNEVALQNAPWAEHPQMATVQNLEVAVALLPLLAKSIQIEQLRLRHAAISIETDAAGRSNLDFAPLRAAPGAARGTGFQLTTIDGIIVEDGRLTIADDRARKTDQMRIDRLAVRAGTFGRGMQVELEGAWNATPFSLAGHIGALQDIQDQQKPWPLDLTLKAAPAQASLKGRIGNLRKLTGIDLQLDAEGRDLEELGALFGAALPLKGRLRFSSRIAAPSPDEIALSGLQVELGDNKLQGDLKVGRRAANPWIAGRLQAETIDLRPVLVATRESAGTPQAQRSRVFPQTPFDTQNLRRIDLDLEVALKALILPQLALDQVHTVIKLADGRLVFDPLTANAGGGTVAGRAVLAAPNAEAAFDTDLVVKGLDLGAMAKILNFEDIGGRLDIDLHTRSQGKSIAGLMGSTDGNLLIALNDTRIPFRYLNLLGANMLKALMGLADRSASYAGPAVIHCLVGAFTIEGGLARTDVLVADTASVTLSGVGTIDLKSEALKLGIATRAKEGIGTKTTGKISVDLGRVTRVFQLTGTLANPEFGLSTRKSLETLVEAAGLTFLMGPVGLATLFLSKADTVEDPCAAALAKAKASSDKKHTGAKTGKEAEEGFGSRLRNLFK